MKTLREFANTLNMDQLVYCIYLQFKYPNDLLGLTEEEKIEWFEEWFKW